MKKDLIIATYQAGVSFKSEVLFAKVDQTIQRGKVGINAVNFDDVLFSDVSGNKLGGDETTKVERG